MARKRGVKRNEREVFLEEIARHGSMRKACLVSGLTRSAVRIAMRDDDDFAQAYADACEDSTDRLEEVAFLNARLGEEKLLRYLLDAKRYKKGESPVTATPSISINIGTPK